MSERAYNFSAGPAGLPLAVLEQVREELLCYPGAGASVMEISHRSKAFEGVLQGAKDNIKQLLNLPENYHVLFCQGGATLQFTMLAMNLKTKDQSADYIDCGAWARKAISEGKKVGPVRKCWSGESERFTRMPEPGELDLDPNAAYVHMTSNETIEGVECFVEPETNGLPLVCDASSDFLSRQIDITKYGLMYAGAQKNIGPAGVAVAILRDDLLARTPAGLPSLLDYKVLAENDSMYNTPPCFAIYLIGLTTKWLLNDMGGLAGIEQRNREKAAIVYNAIDSSGGFYTGHAQPQNRSLMNVTFVLKDSALDADFAAQAKAAGLHELKGHRSVGGFRASIYNAMTPEGCQALADFMGDFAKKNG